MNAEDRKTYETMARSLFDAINAEYWDGNLPVVPVLIGRGTMTRSAGLVRVGPNGLKHPWNVKVAKRNGTGFDLKYAEIRLSPVMLEKGFVEEVLVETLKHEMAHLHQLVTQGGMDHGESHGTACLRMKCSPTRCHSIGRRSDDGRYVYYCPQCLETTRHDEYLRKHESGAFCPCWKRIGGGPAPRFFLAPAKVLAALLPDLKGVLEDCIPKDAPAGDDPDIRPYRTKAVALTSPVFFRNPAQGGARWTT